MRNKVVLLIILISVLTLSIGVVKGIHIEGLEIPSIEQLKEKNEKLDEKINKASTLTAIDYEDNIQMLEETYEKYRLKKQKYEELSEFSGTDAEDIYEKKQYDIGYLWRILGKNAASRNLTLSMNVERGGSQAESLYNLDFNVSGQYVNISQFITDIENNSDLNFRIYNFKMSGSGETISATFTVKNINIDPSTLTTVSS